MLDADDLARRLCRVLKVADTTVTVLLDRGDWNAEQGDPRPEKVLSETALLLLFASRVDRTWTEVHERVEALAQRLLPHARSDRVLAGITLTPAFALELGCAHACLSRLGYPDPGFDRVFADALASARARRRERVPYRELELEWIGRVWDPASTAPEPDPQLPARTTAALGFDALDPAREDAYAFTHSLIYLTDFGLTQERLPRPAAELAADSESALAAALDDDDFDVAGELLLAWPLLQQPWTPSAVFALRVLARVEDEVGYLPSISLEEERYRELEGFERKRYTVAEAYHTVYVMGLLCAAILQSGTLPPTRIGPNRNRGAARILEQELLLPKDTEPQWRTDARDLRTPERDAVAAFLVGAALRRAVHQTELERVREILQFCIDRALRTTPAMLEAADLLGRMASVPYAGGGVPSA